MKVWFLLALGFVVGWLWYFRPNAIQPDAAGIVPHPRNFPALAPPRPPGASLQSTPLKMTVTLRSAELADWRENRQREALTAELVAWAETDPAAAVEWLDQVPVDVRDRVQLEVAGAIVSRLPIEAIRLLSAVPPSKLADQMLRQATMEFADRHPRDAQRWADSQPDSRTRDLLRGAVLTAHSAEHPAEAAGALSELSSDDPLRSLVLVEVVQRWAQRDAPAAAEYVATLSGDDGFDAAENLILQWGAEDPEAANRWALQRPDSILHKVAERARRLGVASDVAPDDPTEGARMSPALLLSTPGSGTKISDAP